MPEVVKLMRCPIDTQCECGKNLPFGVWVYYNTETGAANCIECAVKKGWKPKRRVKNLIKSLELREDIKSLRNIRKLELRELMRLKRRIEIHKLGEKDLELEKQIAVLMDTVKDYLFHAGTPGEKEAFDEVFAVIRQTQELQKEVRVEVQNQLYVVKRKEAKEKKKSQQALA